MMAIQDRSETASLILQSSDRKHKPTKAVVQVEPDYQQ